MLLMTCHLLEARGRLGFKGLGGLGARRNPQTRNLLHPHKESHARQTPTL